MAYLPGFKHDIFISYAHVDDQVSWVELFHKQLEITLNQRVGRMGVVKIWRDEQKLHGNQLFNRTIQDAINSSALFVALTSNGYLASTYCQDELKWFREKAAKEVWELSVNDRLRLFNALLYNIHYSRWPKEYEGTSGHPFHDSERDDQLGYPSVPSEKNFISQMRKLCEAIHATLEAFRERIEKTSTQPLQPAQSAQPAPAQASGGGAVLLADTADSLRKLRNRVAIELRQQGVNLVDPIPPPFEAEEHDQRVAGELGRVELSVHLLDGFPGREIQNNVEKTYPQRQVELGLQHAPSQVIWVPQSLDIQTIEDEAHRDFLDQLENGKRDRTGYRFIRESQTAIPREIVNMLEQLKQAAAAQNGSFAVLLETHLKDQLHALDLGRTLTEWQIRLHLHSEGDEPGKSVRAFEEGLRQVDRLIIVFGSVTEDWVRERLGAAVKFAITTSHPLKSCGVYFAPPRSKSANGKFKLPFLPVYEFDSQDLTDPQMFRRVFG